ncbi:MULTISPECIES: MmcQ/YjbR family DNA-binding protein [unclassified Moritella]|uniref:MmcQ/YjbR family DNA-binding protein n=1 Tax=unclassified Moritella TaxID=2637987 RepID=UPI001BAB6DC3|nr:MULTISPECIES: MmcQ/YjbR family DNA-binding protein [unclassified Moritella]QUM79915.1 MmcQ/YjbR family DNA-binding protein [Moritella sp. 5]QUM84143.1 MmcQ/YjbR family DNA-binding protein [Moritella sp. 28]QUM88444.1 MmcQ/YjbR family DNA-binding protein [Moritella sp. 36]
MEQAHLEHYLHNLKAAQQGYPFGPDVLVYKVMGKMFALLTKNEAGCSVNFKAQPSDVEVLVDEFMAISPGYHMNKRHWITVKLKGDVPAGMIENLASQSYALVVSKLTKKLQLELDELAYIEKE